MTSRHTTEKNLQEDLVKRFITNLPEDGGLGWQTGRGADVNAKTLLIRSDVLGFLSKGNAQNATQWAELERQVGRHPNDLWGVIEPALVDLLKRSDSNIQALRSGVLIQGLQFALYNDPPQRNTTQSSARDHLNNCHRMSPEVSIPFPFPSSPNDPKRFRPDLMFHVNGIYFSYSELKAKQTGQSASDHGRRKIVADYQDCAFSVLKHHRAEWSKTYGSSKPWPGYARLPLTHKREINWALQAFERSAWLMTMDMSSMFLLSNDDSWLTLVDDAIEQGQLTANSNDRRSAPMIKMVTEMPPIADLGSWDQVKCHLSGLLHPIRGVAQEIRLFHHARDEKNVRDSASNPVKDVLRPRPAQRVMLNRATEQLELLYQSERDPNSAQAALSASIRQSLPNIQETEIQSIINARFKYKNGQDAYSMILQGAAGLGKTNIAVWLSIILANAREPRRPEDPSDLLTPSLYDRIIVLTDRTELRDNIAQEAERNLGTKNQVVRADTADVLKAALTGAPMPSHVKADGTIVVVNLQKFPNLLADLAESGISLSGNKGRTAFIIDEVHRSQNGTLNEQATNVFVDSVDALARGSAAKKNLIIGLTATPSDTILARFGQWHTPTAPSDPIKWKPLYAYTLRQAIEDKVILDPCKKVVRHNVMLTYDAVATEAAAKASGSKNIELNLNVDRVYEDPARQELVAQMAAKVFAEITMRAIPFGFAGVKVGAGKMMVTCNSIWAAIGMQDAMKKALLDLAQNAQGTPWERYAEIVKEVANERLFVLYSDSATQGSKKVPKCSTLNDGRGERDIISAFRCSQSSKNEAKHNAIIIVVDKLLTGFDEPTLHTLLIDRSLSGIGLFQAMCRVNRITKNKTDTLIIDTCHDDTIMKEYPKVFKQYGDLSVSELDGLPLIENLDKRHQDILSSPTMKSLWAEWKKAKAPEAILLLKTSISDATSALIKAAPEESQSLRKQVGGYLKTQGLSRVLVSLDPKHTNANEWLVFLKEVHTLLRVSQDDNITRVDVEFDVSDIEFDTLLDTPEDPEEASGSHARHHTDTLADHLVKDLLAEESVYDRIAGKITDLMEIEQSKARRSTEVRTFLDSLFFSMDKSAGSDLFKKSVISNSIDDQSHEEKTVLFSGLLRKGGDLTFKMANPFNREMLKRVENNWMELMMFEYQEHIRKQHAATQKMVASNSTPTKVPSP